MANKLYIGSGNKIKEGFISVDIFKFKNNVVWDIRKGYEPWKDQEINYVWCENFLEHLTYDEAIKFLNDTWEVLKKNNGTLYIDVPSINREAAYEFTHRSWYSTRTFEELESGEEYIYGIKNWEIEKMVVNDKKNIHVWMHPIDQVYDEYYKDT